MARFGPNLYRRALVRRRRSGWGSRGDSFPDRGTVECQVQWELAASCLRSSGPWFARRVVVVVGSGGFGCEQDVVAAARDLARDGQAGAATATAFDSARVEGVVGAALAVAVVGVWVP